MARQRTNEDMFQHKPLKGGRQIRLIHLETPRKNSQPLRCQIKEACLDDNPEYSTMSYAWDAQTQTVPLICDGRQLLITPNCEKGLRRFAKIPAGQIMWVDSICIDQTSTSEKNHQVNMMGAIYSQAATVLVWLGETDEKSSYGFDQLRNLGEHGTSAERTSQAFRDEDIAKRTDMIPFLFEKSWFHRMWVVQEVSLPNPSQVLLFCGNTYIRWKHFVRGVLKYGKLSASGIPECLDVFIYLHGLLGPNRRVNDAEHDRRVAKTIIQAIPMEVRKPFTLLLSKVKAKKCQDPRDRVFALYSVFKALPIRVTVDLPSPDYRKAYHSVESEIRLWISQIEEEGIANIGTLNILPCPQGSEAISKSPVEAVGMPLLRPPVGMRDELNKRWTRSQQELPIQDKMKLLFGDGIFPEFIGESRSCWVMGRWINAILDLAFTKSQVDEYRATKCLPLPCTQKLEHIFRMLCPTLRRINEVTSIFETWANTVFSVHDSDFAGLNEAISQETTGPIGRIFRDRWTKCGHWWDVVGPLNSSLTKIHEEIMESCCGKSLWKSKQGDLLLVDSSKMRKKHRGKDWPTFLVHYETPGMVTLLQESGWTWTEGRLKLCYDVMAIHGLVGHLEAPSATWTLMLESASPLVHVPKAYILSDDRRKEAENQEAQKSDREDDGDAMADRVSNADAMTTGTQATISYGSEDNLNGWWPSWFL